MFHGAEGPALAGFLEGLRPLIVAVPASLPESSPDIPDRLLSSEGIPHLRTPSHLFLSVSSPEQVLGRRFEGPGARLMRIVAASLESYLTPSYRVPIPGGEIDLAREPLVMGIVNVTPDSFSDGGSYRTPDEAVSRGLDMESEGAAILDVGGESTRPGSGPVPLDEELRRVIPVIRGLAARTKAMISVDTTKAAVAREAIAAGATIVNDTSAFADDPGMAAVVGDSKVAAVLMHRRGTTATMQAAPHYDSLFDELLGDLSERIVAAVAAGVSRERILVDPGIGFGKRLCDNLALHRHLSELRVLGRPIVFGPSRKSFIGTLTGAPPADRAFGTAASVAAAVLNGAHVLRVHDVKQIRQTVQVANAIRRAAPC